LTHHHDFGLLMESGVRVVVAFVRPGHFPPAKTISQLERILDSEVAVDAGVLVVSGVGDSLKIRVRARRSPSG
jgi:hypothetical protein